MQTIIIIAVVLLIGYLFYDLYSSAKTDQILDRLNTGFDEDTNEEDVSLWDGAADLLQLNQLRNLLYASAISRKFDLLIRRSSIKINFIQVVTLMIFIIIGLCVTAYLLGKSLAFIITPVIAVPAIFWGFFSFVSSRQQKRIDNQLPAMVTSLLTTMRAGGTPLQALQATVKNASNPMRDSIESVMNNLQLGKTANSVWKDWADFWDTKNTKLLATGIRLKWEAGGEMSSILEHILESIEFNKRIELKVSTLTAQSKLSAFVLGALPFGLFALQYYKRPDLINAMMNSEVGNMMIIYSFTSTIIGLIVLLKIAKLKS